MRTTVAAAVACLIAISLSHAADTHAAIKKETNIPAQGLGPALRDLANERDFQIVYVSEDVNGLRTSGATGQLTTQEALTKLLDGTGLAYRHLDDKTITVYPVAASGGQQPVRSQPPRTGERVAEGTKSSTAADAPGSGAEKEVPKSFWQRLRLAQAETRDTTRTSEAGSTDDNFALKTMMLEEVIVTAQKREERLQDVPISISVMTGEQLDTSTLTNLTETLNRIPGVVATVPSLGNPLITMRGAPPTTGTGGVIGYYVDSVPFGFARQGRYPDMNVYDFERIEVLRGPQGTLYGANSMTGVIRLLTKAPDLNRFEAKTRASVASIEDGGENYRADAAVNIPIIEDRLAMRLVGGYQELGGWIDKPNDEDANRGDIKTLRVKLRAQPTQALTLDAAAWFSRSSFGAQAIGCGPDARADARCAGVPDRSTPVTDKEPYSHDFDTYSLTAVYDFGGASITSATSYIDFALDNSLSFQAINFPGFFLTSGFDAKVFSEEITLQSTQEGPWRWSVGAMYRDAQDLSTSAINGFTSFDFDDRSESFALFGEATRELLDGQIEATLGLRYFHDEFSAAENFNSGGGPLLSMEDTEDALTPRAVLAWHPTEGSTIYASYAQGFRSGLAQTPDVIHDPLFAGSRLGAVGSDKLSNYEIGAKSTLLEGRLSLESAVYYMDWQDVQAQLGVRIATGLFVNALVNGPSASGMGIDTMVTFRPTEGFEIGGSVSWNDLTMDDEVESNGFVVYNKGDRLAFSPEMTANGFVEYSFPLGSLTGRLGASVNYISSQNQVSAGPTVYESDSLTTTSARFTVDSGGRWSASLFGDNLSDENGIPTSNADIGPWQPRLPPRTIGIQFEYHY